MSNAASGPETPQRSTVPARPELYYMTDLEDQIQSLLRDTYKDSNDLYYILDI